MLDAEYLKIWTERVYGEGNSGGALVAEDGSVAGVIFARASDAEIGYALTRDEISQVVTEAPGLSDAVATGHCLEE